MIALFSVWHLKSYVIFPRLTRFYLWKSWQFFWKHQRMIQWKFQLDSLKNVVLNLPRSPLKASMVSSYVYKTGQAVCVFNQRSQMENIA